MRWIKPLDKEIILQLTATHNLLVTLEDNAISGGAGSAVNELVAEHDRIVSILNLGIPDEFIEHGSQLEQKDWCHLTAEKIKRAIAIRHQQSSSQFDAALHVN
jgi:1-deoxy-D-xylulose-5-phosphate synthase